MICMIFSDWVKDELIHIENTKGETAHKVDKHSHVVGTMDFDKEMCKKSLQMFSHINSPPH